MKRKDEIKQILDKNELIEQKLNMLLIQINAVQVSAEQHQVELVDRLQCLQQAVRQAERKKGVDNAENT
uniref:Uncharacterized protein n=1 Tax=viral metagenome TaxID=1070528 RepID=A0A6H1ZD37_9ZZZZ